MVKRIVIYGYVVSKNVDHDYALVDLTYFVDDFVTPEDVFSIIKGAGYRMVPKYIDDDPALGREKENRVEVEDWDSHITQNVTVGSEQMPEGYQQPTIDYGRYNYPQGGI